MEPQTELIEKSFDKHYSTWVYEALDELPDNFTITDPFITGHPIVFASQGCLRMFGYSKEEVVGRNGRMFQGHGTCRRTVMQIREAIREESKEDGKAINFVAVQVPILRKPRHSRSKQGRNEFCLCGDGITREILLGSCRREVCFDSMVEPNHCTSLDSVLDTDKGVDVEELCEASEPEKQKATNAINNILSVLTQYGALRRKSVSGRRCSLERIGLCNSVLLTSLGRIKQSFVLIDPHLPNMPIVYASESFLKLTGYARHEVLGRKHRFLSGSETDSFSLLQIDDCIQNKKPCKVRVLDFRKDMTTFWNQLHISPLRNASGKVAYFIEVHMEEDSSTDQNREKLNPEMRQLGAIAAAKVAVRSATMGPGPST
ncbi:hypothetical protein vseg_019958 [Gypsophila vaccaria]